MSNWRRVNEIITYYGKGVTPKYVDNSSIIVLNQKCVRNNKIDYSFAQYIDDSKIYNEDKILKIGDILINSTGQGTAGRVAMVEYIPKGFRLIVDSHILVLRTNNFFESKCLNYSLFSIESTLQTFMDGSTGQGEFDKIRLFNVNVGYPKDNTIQQKIAKVLSDLDAKIELNNKINVELEAMAKTLYDYWFVQFDFPFVTSSGVEKPYKSLGGKMVWNEALKREIPEGWEVKELDSVIDKIIDYRGRTPKKLNSDWSENINDIIAVSAKHIKKGKLVNLEEANRVSTDLYSKWMKEELAEGDILMTSEAPCGEFFYLIGETKFCLSQRVFAIRSNNKIINHSCLYFELSSGNGYSQIMGKMSGSTVFGIRQDELRTVNVLIPDKDLQNIFEEKILPIYRKIRINDKQNQELALLRDWLLPMLMNGQVTVGETVDIEDREELKMIVENPEAKVLSLQDKKLRRKMLATFIVNQSLSDPSFGKTKFEKLLHLIEYHIVKNDYNQRYSVQTAGPYDGGFTNVFWDEVIRSKWFRFEELGNLKRIVAGENHVKSLVDYGYFSDDLKESISRFISLFKLKNYKKAEVISTLYAVWNNRLIKNEMITDALLKKDFLEWDKQKAQYAKDLESGLNWMRSENIIPNGWGKYISRAKSKKK